MKSIHEISKDALKDMVVLVRAGLNLPVDEERNVVDTFRITTALPTLTYLRAHAKQVVILAHIGRGREESLAPVARALRMHMPETELCQWRDLARVQESGAGSKVLLVENVRQDPRETSMNETDRIAFAQEVVAASGADIFVQDAFSVCHRAHASIVNMPQLLPSYGGLLLKEEQAQLQKALNPPSPSLFILGGAKFTTKEPLIRKFLSIYDRVFIGGAIANEFFKERGYEIGKSLVYDGNIPHDILYNERIMLPSTVIAADLDGHAVTVGPKEVLPNMRIVDAMPPSDLVSNIKFLLWNGPLGYYEGGFGQGTQTLLRMCKSAYEQNNLQILTGGGDTLATVGSEYRDAFTHISAGGGAMLTFLQDGALVGITALEK